MGNAISYLNCRRRYAKETNEYEEQINSLENETNAPIVASVCIEKHLYGYCYAFKPHENSSHRISTHCKVWKNEDNVREIRGEYLLDITDRYAQIIRVVREDLLTNLKKRKPEVKDIDIRWVLTIPAISSIKECQYMRKAAEQGGIPSSQQQIVKEPVAAALYCAQDKLPDGSRYLVTDLGGETTNITVHKKEEELLIYALGLPIGGNKVNSMFERFCYEKIGKEIFEAFKINERKDYDNLLSDFELKKTSISKKELCCGSCISIPLPTSLLKAFDTSLLKTCNPPRLQADNLIINIQEFQSFYDEPLNRIIQELKELKIAPEIKNITTMMVVGGFAESSIVVRRLKQAFPDWAIIVPADPGLAVLKGAVYYGLKCYDERDLEVFSQGYCALYNDFIITIPERENIKHFLIYIMGEVVLIEMILNHVSEYNELWFSIHNKLQGCQQHAKNVKFIISHTWRTSFEKENGISLSDSLINRSDLNGEVQCKGDKLIIGSAFFQSKFETPI